MYRFGKLFTKRETLEIQPWLAMTVTELQLVARPNETYLLLAPADPYPLN